MEEHPEEAWLCVYEHADEIADFEEGDVGGSGSVLG